jgi:anaerobic selenocysteine-containing dehydrogenase
LTSHLSAVCPHDCWDACALRVEVSDGRAVRIEGDPDHPVTRGVVCAKVRRYLDRVYGPQRLLTPRIRTGPKGAGEFREASWEEALELISRRYRRIAAQDGPAAILPYSYYGTHGVLQSAGMDRRFFHRLGASRLERTICSAAGSQALNRVLGTRQGADPEAMADNRLIVFWGQNPFSTNLHGWLAAREAQKGGALLVTIDPYRHAGARRSDWHLAPLPGTDVALALGIMREILDRGWEDRDYLARHTRGREALARHLAAHPVERCAERCGLDAADIRELARLWAHTRPALVRLGYGVQRHTHGGAAVRAISLLPALTGAWRDPGGGLLLSNSGAFPLNTALLERPELAPGPVRSINMNRLGEALTQASPPVRALHVYNANPAVVAPHQNLVLAGLSREDLFMVVHDQWVSDTGRFADVLLPATTQLEHLDLHTSYWHLYLGLNQPCIAPRGEAKPNTEAFRLLARAMGFTEDAFADSDWDLAEQALSSGHPFLAGVTLERLRREYWVRLNTPQRPHVPFRDGFATPDGRVDLAQVPDWAPPAESREGSPALHQRYPLHLVTPAAHHFLNSTYGELPWAREREGTPHVFLHPADAAARGIADGDAIRIHNDRGAFRATARVGDHTRPGVAVSPGGWHLGTHPEGRSCNATTSDALADLGGGATFHTNLVQVERVPTKPHGDWVS